MMLRPSYNDLMNVINKDTSDGEEPLVQSRYSVVIATAKRARQIIGGDEPQVYEDKKPLSLAIDELYQSKVKIVGDDESKIEE